MTNEEPDPASSGAPNFSGAPVGAKSGDAASIDAATPRYRPPGNWNFVWSTQILEGVAYGPIIALAAFVIVLMQGDAFATSVPSLWFAWCLILAPLLILGVLLREEGGDIRVTVAALAAGAAPGVFFLPGLWASGMPAVMVTFPLLVAWGVACHVVALNQDLVMRHPRVLGPLLILGGLANMVIAAGLLAALTSGLLAAVWTVVCVPLALVLGFTCLKLWLAAARSSSSPAP